MKSIKNVKRVLIDTYKTVKLYRFYSPFKKRIKKQKPMLISMIDGRINHGGISDRMFGIISAFLYCQRNNLDFRINFTYPFLLENFLEPNEYDWRIKSEDISYNILQAKPLYISQFSLDSEIMRKNADIRLIHSIPQLHLYSNMVAFSEHEFRLCFNKLFKKSYILETAIARNLAKIASPYVSITFRFQQLLGDLKETGYRKLKSDTEKECLMMKCLNCIEKLHEKTGSKILVTSDSVTFLNFVQKRLSYVFVISGTVVHMDYCSKDESVDLNTHLKSFVDLFMIANAETIYLADINPLYRSAFPKFASWIYNKKFVTVNEELEYV